MKIKKIKLLKALALTSSLGIVATVPIIVSSCSTTSSDENNNNNNGTNAGNGDTTNKQKASFQSTIKVVGSLNDIYTKWSDKNTLLETALQKDPSKLLTNSNIGDNVKVTVEGNFPTSSWTIQNNHGIWKTEVNPAKEVYYPMSSAQFNISSPDDLKTKLDANALSNIFKAIDESNRSNTYKLVENKSLCIDVEHNLLDVAVEQTKGSEKTIIDLAIPASDINLINTCSITVSSDNIEETKAELPITYDIGVNSDSKYDNSDPETIKLTNVSPNSAMVELGFATEKASSTFAQRSSFSTTRDGEETSDINIDIDSQKIGEETSVFNTEFSNPTLTKDATSAKDDSAVAYTLTLQGKPTDGHTWENGKSDSKTFEFKLKIKN